MISILACKLYAIPIIVSEHNNHTYKNHPFWLSKIAWRYIYPMANLVTVLTQYDLEYFQRLGAKTFVMPNPCTFDPVLDGHSDRSKTIVAVGNLDRYYQKGFDNLIPIVSKVLEEYPEWDLKIIGAGNRGKRIIEEQIEKTGFADKIKMLGERKDVDLILRESSILILPSRMEGLPMVLLEAMSQGIAVIAYDCVTGPSEIIDDGIDGLLIENQNIKAMQTGLRKLISDDTFRKTLATQGVKKINDYSIEKVYSKWLEAIKSI
jgi:glycosyltransferase involved in cell wall biosynthesis